MWRSLSLGDSKEERGLKYGCCMLKMCVRQIMCTIGCYCPQERETKGFSRSPSRHHQQPCYVCEKFQNLLSKLLPCFPSHHYSAVGHYRVHSLNRPVDFPWIIFFCVQRVVSFDNTIDNEKDVMMAMNFKIQLLFYDFLLKTFYRLCQLFSATSVVGQVCWILDFWQFWRLFWQFLLIFYLL